MTWSIGDDDAAALASRSLCGLVDELKRQAAAIDSRSIAALTARIVSAERLFITAAGRSAVVSRGFANRMMHMGFEVFYVGDITTPAITADDTLLVVSNSGRTGSPLAAARTAHALGAEILAITGAPDNPLAELSTRIVVISNNGDLDQPLNSLSEQLTFLTLESIVLNIMAVCQIDEDEMRARHANLE